MTATSRARGLTLRIFLATALVVVVVIGATLAVTARTARTAADGAVDRVLRSAREAVVARLDGNGASLRRAAGIFTANPQFRALVRDRDLSSVLDQAAVAVDELGASWVQIVDDAGVRLAKSDDEAAPADSLGASPTIARALAGDTLIAFGISGDTALAQVVTVPVQGAAEGRAVVGALMAARLVDATTAAEIRAQAGDAVEVAFSYLGRDDLPRLAAATLADTAEVAAALRAFHATAGDSTSDARIDVEIGATHYVGLGQLLRSATGTPLGAVLMLRDRDAEFAAFTRLQRTLLVAGALGILLAGLLALLVARGIVRPVDALVTATRRAAEGDYAADIPASGTTELDVLADAVRRLLGDLREKGALVEFLSAGGDARTVRFTTEGLSLVRRAQDEGIRVGERFANRYDVQEILGEGGMGVVFRAVDTQLGEPIAIKTLRPEFLTDDPSALERFKSEIRLARRISHRNVVRTHDLGEWHGTFFLSMELVEGTSLKSLIRARGRLPVPVTLSVGKQLARALEVAHEQGVIHRDIKPQNIVVEPSGVLKVMDFGIARLAERAPDAGVTQAGHVVGTPEYMAPEQCTGESTDHRIDLYAAGCVLYECLVGEPPFTAETPFQVIGRLLSDPPAHVRDLVPGVPEALDALIHRCLAKDPLRRPATAAELHDALDAIG